MGPGKAGAIVVLLALSACGRPSLVGTWAGRDEAGGTVVYTFNPDGTGRLTLDAREQPMTYRVREGYPDLIEIAVGADSARTRRGIVEIMDGRMKLELGSPGGSPPDQLSRSALVLRQPATR
jgi:hypothetical protein